MVIAAILVAVAVSSRPDDVKARYQAERLRTDLRYAQMLALTWGVTLRMTTAAGSYSVACASGASGPCASSPVVDPATGAAFSVSLESGLTLSPVTTFDLDSLGRPRSSGGALLSTDTTFQVAASGGPTYTVTVRPTTGFAVVTP